MRERRRRATPRNACAQLHDADDVQKFYNLIKDYTDVQQARMGGAR